MCVHKRLKITRIMEYCITLFKFQKLCRHLAHCRSGAHFDLF